MSSLLGDQLIRSGQTIRLRLIQKEDAALLVDLFDHLSSETKRLRFHLYTEKLPKERIWREAIALSDLDPQRHVAVVGTIVEEDGQERALGVARLARESVHDREAEIAIVVRDDYQRKGLGKLLLQALVEQGRRLNITHFTGWVLSENLRLMKLIQDLEFPIEAETKYGQSKIRVPI